MAQVSVSAVELAEIFKQVRRGIRDSRWEYDLPDLEYLPGHRKHKYSQFPERLGRWWGAELHDYPHVWSPGVPEVKRELACMRSIFHHASERYVYCSKPHGHSGSHCSEVERGYNVHWRTVP